jgi:hypothetical protein
MAKIGENFRTIPEVYIHSCVLVARISDRKFQGGVRPKKGDLTTTSFTFARFEE